jgi:hypothetical protein
MTTGQAGLFRNGTVVLMLLAGCSSSKEDYLPVQGMVRVNGQPLPAGTIVFHPDATKGNTSKREPRGTIGKDEPGRYRLTTDGRDGAPPGHYQVAVFPVPPVTQENSQRPPEWLADPKYADVRTSDLTVEVRRDANAETYNFNLLMPSRPHEAK